MSRRTPEWIGKTEDSAIPPRVRLRVFEAHNGMCYLTGRKITAADKWDVDHVVALCNGGDNRESNLAPALREEHKKKTAQDVATKAKDRRVRSKHLGIAPKKRKMPYRRFNGDPVWK
jgi:5-methylcytosine-specific restriction protein A